MSSNQNEIPLKKFESMYTTTWVVIGDLHTSIPRSQRKSKVKKPLSWFDFPIQYSRKTNVWPEDRATQQKKRRRETERKLCKFNLSNVILTLVYGEARKKCLDPSLSNSEPCFLWPCKIIREHRDLNAKDFAISDPSIVGSERNGEQKAQIFRLYSNCLSQICLVFTTHLHLDSKFLHDFWYLC